MKKNKKYIILNEYKSLFVAQDGEDFDDGGDEKGNKFVDQKTFDDVSDFVFNVASKSKHKKAVIKTDAGDDEKDISVMSMGQKYIAGKNRPVLTASSFVGVIVTRDGTTIEILPKINKDDNEKTRVVFLKMLRALRQSPNNKIFRQANLNSSKMPLMEIFITMFCEEVANLVRKGLKSDYIEKSSNEKFLKGKLNLKKQLQYNIVNKERFYVSFDEYLVDIAENRLLKTTIKYLFAKTKNGKNKKRLRELLFIFDEIDVSKNIEIDFASVKVNRTMKNYKQSLQWARIFLGDESFTPFYGKGIAFALLFDMNKIFEDYVAHCLRKTNQKVETQKTGKSLIEKPHKFNLRPDLLITSQEDDLIVADTKWKLVNSGQGNKNWNISQSDIYQMFAYGKKFESKKIHLIYPKNENFNSGAEIGKMYFEYFQESNENNFSLDVKCFDCDSGEFV